MKNIYTIPFTESFIDRFVDYIDTQFIQRGVSLDRVAIVFGGKRPGLFLKRALAKRLKGAFVSPHLLTIDDWMKHIVYEHEPFKPAVDLDHCYVLYQLAQRLAPEVLKGRESFSTFLPWAREILAFMDQLDLEQIDQDSLLHIEASATIGYDVPEPINQLLQSICVLREHYHQFMTKHRVYARGFQYHRAAELIEQTSFDQYDAIVLANFFYFHRTEAAVAQALYQRGKTHFVFQGDQRRWPVLERTAERLNVSIKEDDIVRPTGFDLKLYAGADAHTQVGLVRTILEKIDRQDRAVVVLPNPDLIMPLLSEISPLLDEFNISMGYPLKRSSLYGLIDLIFRAQRTQKENLYYARDYLRVLQHPFVRGFDFFEVEGVGDVLISHIDQALKGELMTAISGQLFVDLNDIGKDEKLLAHVIETLSDRHITVTEKQLQEGLEHIHELFFAQWNSMARFEDFIDGLDKFLKVMTTQTVLRAYPLNIKIANRMWSMIQELRTASFLHEPFEKEDMFRMMAVRMENEIVAFVGSPLKGLQILGLFETRSLDFDHVIMLDVNEGVLPRLTVTDPLIPRDIMVSLGLNRLELEEEIQRYQFMRLISSAKDVHLIYREGKGQERSRFIEELVWEEEKKEKQINAIGVTRGVFPARVTRHEEVIPKTQAMVDFLKNFMFSASSVNTYMRSPIQFYYQYVLGLREKEDLLDEPENRHIGNFVHEILEDVFLPYVGKTPNINQAFAKKFMQEAERRFDDVFGRGRGSDAYLMKSVLHSRLKRFLELEADRTKRPVEKVLFIEKRFDEVVKLPAGDIKFTYRVDRVDQLEDGTVLILDYKTGSVDPMPKKAHDVEQLPQTRESLFEHVRSFQMPLYLHYLHQRYPDKSVNAAFYNLRTLDIKSFISNKDQPQRQYIVDVFMQSLNVIFEEMFDVDVPFM